MSDAIDELLQYARGEMLDDEDFKNFFADKLREGERRMSNLEQSLQELRGQLTANTLIAAEAKSEMREVLDILRAVKGGLRVVGAFGFVIKWLAAVAAAWAILWAALTNNFPWK